ncbi:MAG: hypothetical protein QOE90_715 [Thermoplasmata archaeon]|jgi:hypothetical protein|nr:hypothetical protein [Thermoplasmata archaeon]
MVSHTVLQAPGARPTWTAIVTDAECHAHLRAQWVGALADGPASLVDPILSKLGGASPEVNESDAAAARSGDGQPSGRVAPRVTSCKSSDEHVFMYGGGGPSDSLTHKNGYLDFCYDGSTAWISAQSGNCQGSTEPWWSWVVDACYLDRTINGPDYAVREGHGNYHCDPTTISPCNFHSEYYHSLYDSETGRWDGYTACSYSWTGTISFGVTNEYLQGCQ